MKSYRYVEIMSQVEQLCVQGAVRKAGGRREGVEEEGGSINSCK